MPVSFVRISPSNNSVIAGDFPGNSSAETRTPNARIDKLTGPIMAYPGDLLGCMRIEIAVLKTDSTVTWTNGHPGRTDSPRRSNPWFLTKFGRLTQSTGETGTGEHQIPSDA